MTDFVPNSEVKYYFSAADLVVQPYRNATQSGITQVAYHFEKPMIVTNVGGLSENVPHGKVGIVTDPDPQAIAGAVLQFFNQPVENLQQHLQAEKKKYSWDTFTGVLLQTAGLEA
jgi:glycosyltransferase involved in cell wall biosynthesis